MDSIPNFCVRQCDENLWNSNWQRGVQESLRASLLIELPSTRIIELSSPAAELLGVVRADDVQLKDLVFADRQISTPRASDLLATGVLETVHGQFRFRRPDGVVVGAWCWARAIRSPHGADLGLVGIQAAVGSDGSNDAVVSAPVVSVLADGATLGDPLVGLRLDERWQVERVTPRSPNRPDPLDVSPGAFVLDLVDRQQRTDLLGAFALATTGVPVIVRLQMISGEGTTTKLVSAVVSLDRRHEAALFVLELYTVEDPVTYEDAARAIELELRLSRIDAAIRRAEVLAGSDGLIDAFGIPELDGLSDRQIEIVARLVQGRRVPDIARHMYLSQSTVRNHLVAVFRKFHVNSQAELIETLRRLSEARRTATLAGDPSSSSKGAGPSDLPGPSSP